MRSLVKHKKKIGIPTSFNTVVLFRFNLFFGKMKKKKVKMIQTTKEIILKATIGLLYDKPVYFSLDIPANLEAKNNWDILDYIWDYRYEQLLDRLESRIRFKILRSVWCFDVFWDGETTGRYELKRICDNPDLDDEKIISEIWTVPLLFYDLISHLEIVPFPKLN